MSSWFSDLANVYVMASYGYYDDDITHTHQSMMKYHIFHVRRIFLPLIFIYLIIKMLIMEGVSIPWRSTRSLRSPSSGMGVLFFAHFYARIGLCFTCHFVLAKLTWMVSLIVYFSMYSDKLYQFNFTTLYCPQRLWLIFQYIKYLILGLWLTHSGLVADIP